MFEELNNEQLMELDGGFSWKGWFGIGATVVGFAGIIAISIVSCGAGAPMLTACGILISSMDSVAGTVLFGKDEE